MRSSSTAKSRAPAQPFCRDCCLPQPWLQPVLRREARPAMDELTAIGQWTAAMLRSSTPLLIVTLGETLTQRIGIINLGVEGQMLSGACAGFAVAAATGDPLIGFAAGAGAG